MNLAHPIIVGMVQYVPTLLTATDVYVHLVLLENIVP
jgi:hypothetical protein